jgi:hypothetical protein
MPSFVSDKGLWYPAKEKIGLTYKGDKTISKEELPEGVVIQGDFLEPGDPFMYEGADREALKMLNESGSETLGTDFRKDPEFRQAIRNQGFDKVEDYLKNLGYDEDEDTKKFRETATHVNKHELPKRVGAINMLGGGRDTTGARDNDIVGGFGDMEIKPAHKKG